VIIDNKMQSGKGSRFRPTKYYDYWINYLEINWNNNKKIKELKQENNNDYVRNISGKYN